LNCVGNQIIMYDVSTPNITYNDSAEYRDAIRQIFKTDNIKTTENLLLKKEDVDDESWDELMFDSNTMTKALSEIYDKTEDHPLFAELYEIAAAQMISTDTHIGQAVLMSYDYFHLYHPCLCTFFSSPNEFNEKCRYYIQLKYALTK